MTKEEQMYVSAVRYALGRMTYIVADTVDFMLGKNLGEQCRGVMYLDIRDAIARDDAGMDMDVDQWKRLMDSLAPEQ